MVLKVAKIVNNNVDSIFFTSESLENLKYILGDGDYVNIDGFSCRVGDTYKNGVIIPNFVGIPTSTTVSPTSVKAIYLMLGSACNMSCRHCTQTPIKCNVAYPTTELSKDVLDFIVKWDKNGGGRLYFWGGEPLLYWTTIKKLIEEFEKIGMSNTSYRIFTNGLLLSNSIVDFCNKHNIWVIMSYDAPNPLAARNAMPLERNIEAFLLAEKRTVNGVYNALNCDMVTAFKYLESKFPNTEVTLGFINVLWDIPKDLYAFRKGEVRKAVKDLFEYYKETRDSNVHRWFETKLRRGNYFSIEEFMLSPFPPCAPGRISLSIDFAGNIIRCHNDDKVVANIKDDYSDILKAHEMEWLKLLPRNCASCECLSLCRSICPIAYKKESNEEFVQCGYIREFFSAVQECADEFWRMEGGM